MRELKLCRRRVIGYWNINSLTGKQHELIQETNYVPWMLLLCLRGVVMFLILLSWTIGRNHSTPVLNQKSLPMLKLV